MIENTENKYVDFFEKIKKFKNKQKKQKQRGLNDFNLLTTVRKYHEEVNLHSAMIGALLNPNGLHYQNTLFLEKFLEILNLVDFELDLSSASVNIEYHDIDLYITDGNKHIIIENKIWADDQPCQIVKYINIIKEENDLSTDDSQTPKIENMYVIYLTPNDKKVPFEHDVKDDYIYFSGTKEKLLECSKRVNTEALVKDKLKNYQVKYKKIDYENDILKWLHECLEEVQNITNLSESIKQYVDVVKMVNNNCKGKVVSLSKELAKEDNFKLAYEISKEFKNTKAKLECEFWNKLVENIDKIDGYIGIKIKKQIDKKAINEDSVRFAQNGNGNSSEISIHFKLKDNVRLLIGSDNRRKEIYVIIFKTEWVQIDKLAEDDKKIIKKIDNITGYTFKKESWCYGESTLINATSLRNEDLIHASSKVDVIADEIKSLVSKLNDTL